jgi:general secretion pathway protein M
MSNGPAQRLSFLRRTGAVLVYVVSVLVLLVLAWSGVAEILARRQSVAAAADLLAQLEGRRAGPFATPSGPTGGGAVPTGSPFLEGQTLTVAPTP